MIKLPQDVIAEKAVLGMILVSFGDIWYELDPDIQSEWFTDPRHKKIFETMAELESEGKDINIHSVSININNYISYISSLADHIPTTVNHHYWTNRIKLIYQRRKVIQTCLDTINQANSEDFNVDEIYSKLLETFADGDSTDSTTPANVSRNLWRGEGSGISTGFDILDEKVKIRNSNMIVLAGRPGTGKSTLVLNISEDSGLKVLFFSLEMSATELTAKMISRRSGLSINAILSGEVPVDPLDNQNIIIVDKINSMSQIERTSHIWKKKKGIDLLIIDYLQLIKMDKWMPIRESYRSIS